MNVDFFLDTNILVYAYDLSAPSKREKALEWVERGWIKWGKTAISVQVLQELHVNLTRKGRLRKEATTIVQDYTSWPIIENSLKLLHTALTLQAQWQLSLWDASILAAAKASGARQLISEDFNHSQVYDGVKIVNPFK